MPADAPSPLEATWLAAVVLEAEGEAEAVEVEAEALPLVPSFIDA